MKKNILITGGNRGIGKGLLLNLCQNHKVFFSVRNEAKGEGTLKSLPEGSTKYIVMDVDSSQSVDSGIKMLKKFSTLRSSWHRFFIWWSIRDRSNRKFKPH